MCVLLRQANIKRSTSYLFQTPPRYASDMRHQGESQTWFHTHLHNFITSWMSVYTYRYKLHGKQKYPHTSNDELQWRENMPEKSWFIYCRSLWIWSHRIWWDYAVNSVMLIYWLWEFSYLFQNFGLRYSFYSSVTEIFLSAQQLLWCQYTQLKIQMLSCAF